jgi:hypothetical protein
MATPPAPPGRDAKLPLRTVGTVLAGLGMATWLAAGVTALVAVAGADDLERECPGRICVEGTRGGDSYEMARDASKATDILVGIAAPVLGTGGILLLFSAAIGPRGPATEARAKVLTAGSTPGSIAVHF